MIRDLSFSVLILQSSTFDLSMIDYQDATLYSAGQMGRGS